MPRANGDLAVQPPFGIADNGLVAVLDNGLIPRRLEDISPELALVDPDLRREARDELPPPGTILGGSAPPAITPTIIHGGLERRYALPADMRLASKPARPAMHAAGWERRAVQAAVGVVVVGVLLAMASKPASQRAPEARSSVATAREVTPAGGATKTATRKPSVPDPQSGLRAGVGRRLAWAPVQGARAYDVELFLGTKRVFGRRTTKPVLDLPRRWQLDGKKMTLVAGEYQWYVWPVTDRGRASSAVVQAKLVVPA